MTEPLDTRGPTGKVVAHDLTNNSFTKMIKCGMIKRTDTGMQIRLKDVHDKLRDDGSPWNRRDMKSEKTQANITAIVKHLQNDGQVPPIEVQPKPGGGVMKIDGYCRTEAFRIIDASGEGELWVDIRPFKGATKLDELRRIETSNHDSKLTPLEQLDLYQSARDVLHEMGEKGTLQQIADAMGVSRQYVDQVLKLGELDQEGRALVESGKVKVADAIKAVRHDKGNATQALKRAAAPRPLMPTKALMDDMYIGLGDLFDSIPKQAKVMAHEYLKGNGKADNLVSIPVGELAKLMALKAEGERQIEAAAERKHKKSEKDRQESMAHDDLKQNDDEVQL